VWHKNRSVNPKEFFGEVKGRNVYKVAVAYVVVGWLLIQIATQVFPFFGIPNWTVRLVVVLAIGFPIALIIAWAFELTPEGIKRTEEVGRTQPHSRGVAWIYIAIFGAALSVALLSVGRYTARLGSAAALPGQVDRRATVRKSQWGPEQRLFCGRHSGGGSHEAVQDR
jgi:hypothetical protein